VPNWYLDMTLLKNYWGPDRKYHHTVPINMIYAFREALRIVMEEGLEADLPGTSSITGPWSRGLKPWGFL